MTNDRYAIQDVLSRYVRFTDDRDADAQSALFTEDGMIRFFSRSGAEPYKPHDEPYIGHKEIRRIMEEWPPLPKGVYMHHITSDHLVEVDGDAATMHAQFILMAAAAEPEPEGGWPEAIQGTRGTISPVTIGFYDAKLRKVAGAWKFTCLDVLNNLPIVAT